MKKYLATTGISDTWDFNSYILFLGPWCITGNEELIRNITYDILPSPWKPTLRIKAAADFCQRTYLGVFPDLCNYLNSIHGLSYPQKYWRILIGPWLIHFISMLYDRYNRIERAFASFPDSYSYVLPKKLCNLDTFDTFDFLFLNGKCHEDYYNWKVFSLIIDYFYPDNAVEKVSDIKPATYTMELKYSIKRKMLKILKKIKPFFYKGNIVLTDMYHLSYLQKFLLELWTGFRLFSFVDFSYPQERKSEHLKRREFKFSEVCHDKFTEFLYKLLPHAIPKCYIENFGAYKESIKDGNFAKVVGSAVGWFFNEKFKFFAAEASLNNTKLVEFQHGGGYGIALSFPNEKLALEKDIFYTWGWQSNDDDSKTIPLPSPYLSSLLDSHHFKKDKLLFVGTTPHKYLSRFFTTILADDMPKYFQDKVAFLEALKIDLQDRILYRPYHETGWREREIIKNRFNKVKFLEKDSLVNSMKKVKLVVIDHQGTSYLEALTINVPCICFWDHSVELVKPEVEFLFDLLRNAGILFRIPEEAAEKVNEIFHNPFEWWFSSDVQNARREFCNRFAYARKDWLKIWKKEFRRF